MRLKRMSRKQKLILLAAGLVFVFFLIATGRMFPQQNGDGHAPAIANEELLILGTAQTTEGLQEGEVYTDRGVYRLGEAADADAYLYESVQAVTEEGTILHISNRLERQVKLENCLITGNSAQEVRIFSEGFTIALPCKNLTVQFAEEIADIYMTNGSVTKISAKKDTIAGKILSVRPDGIELAGYGVVPVTEKFRFYETFGGYAEKPAYGLIVGNEKVRFVVAQGKICAAVQEEAVSPETIRVLLKTTGFADIVHQEAVLRAHGDYEIAYNGITETMADGQELCLNSGSEQFGRERVILTPASDDARMEIASIGRSMGAPSYAGNIEILRNGDGLILINEVDLETYLYGVVPSEMPADYELEALKAQAVCARSYAYRQIPLNGYAAYGAHVDDSVSYQVYNNLPTDEKVMQAVDETAGKVLKFAGETAMTYYFSTSCGHTTNETIWENGSADNSYLCAKLVNDSGEKLDLTTEEAFREFILKEEYDTYDSGEAWYRWDMTVPAEQLAANVRARKEIGSIRDIRITKRNEGGAVQEAVVEGTDGTLQLTTEYEIRTILNGEGVTVSRAHGSDVLGGKMLPSGFFVVDRIGEDEKASAFRFRGGGFGHGAGMSQNGANHMAEAGKSYKEILQMFFAGTSLENIG